MKVVLQKDELEYIESEGNERCDACGHLATLHNYHCCPNCLLENCDCQFGMLDSEDRGDKK